MEGFISQVAEKLYGQYGDGVSSLYILFPSKRARLFFAEALSRVADKPLWQPHYTSIDEIMEQTGGLASGDRIRLITELYTIYSKHHTEPFDTFYFWGEMVLSDFDSIDKYLIDADMLFANISQLKEIEGDLSYLTAEQIAIISQFWKSFGNEAEFSGEKQKFVDIWRSLGPIYHAFRTRLTELGISYTGMAHRAAVAKIKSGQATQTEGKRHYVIAGFNALSECEKRLFDHLSKQHKVDFFWDYDQYYIEDSQQEAGLFLRDNIVRFPQEIPLPHSNRSFNEPKQIVVASAPSDSLQCKYAGQFVKDIARLQGGIVGKETAIVLTNEKLLLPVLHSIPPEVESVNITMGYPLRYTLEYSFAERLLELQSRKKIKAPQTMFYHSDVSGLLTHPFVVESCADVSAAKNREVISRQQTYVKSTHLLEPGLLGEIFATPTGWEELADYLLKIVATVAHNSSEKEDSGQRIEFLTTIADNISKVKNSLAECGVEISERIFASLVRRLLQSVTIPYQGEPLAGVQVMGILETRNLDFENVVILSVNDDTFPGNRPQSSFIPYNLRLAYGLPTPAHHEGVFAYYFYRLLQRAKRVHIVYCSRSDDKSTGEQSRYIYQLDYESTHVLEKINISIDANLSATEPITVVKTVEVMDKLVEFTIEGGRRLSPTSFNSYIECPLKFYFRVVAGLKVEEEMAEDVDSPMFGIILHRSMEILYQPIKGIAEPQNYLRSLIGTPKVAQAVGRAINESYLKDESAAEEDYNGNLLLVKDIVGKYINKCVLPYDSSHSGYTVAELEKKLSGTFKFSTNGESRTIYLMGMADRIDNLENGMVRIVDYKTGAVHVEFSGVESLFAEQTAKNKSGAILQTLIYSMLVYHDQKRDVQPALYYVRKMNAAEYSPMVRDKSKGVAIEHYSDYRDEFEEYFGQMLSRIFDRTIPFTQCSDPKMCEYCDFREICRR